MMIVDSLRTRNMLVSDSFDRADSTTVLGTTDSYSGGSPAAWVQRRNVWGISSNRAYISDASDGGESRATVDVGTGNVQMQASLYVGSTANRWDGGLCARYDTDTSGLGTGILFATYNDKSPDVACGELYVCIAGVATLRGSTATPTFTSGGDTLITLIVSGANVYGIVAGSFLTLYTLSGAEIAALTGTHAGLRHGAANNTANSSWTNLTISRT